VKIRIERPDARAARQVFARYLTADLPISEEEIVGDDRAGAVDRLIDQTVEDMYSQIDINRFLEVTYQNGDKDVLYFKDFSSGAMIENIVRRAKKLAIKRLIAAGQRG